MSQMTKYEKSNIRIQAESLAAQIMDNLPDPEITTAASLAYHGMLGSVHIWVEPWLSSLRSRSESGLDPAQS